MSSRIRPIVLGLVFMSHHLLGYEWHTHNGMSLHARRMTTTVQSDPDLRNFLEEFGESDLDTRAGDPFERAFVDEDATDIVPWGAFCEYRERACYVKSRPDLNVCTFNHFYRPLPVALLAGLSETDAVSHAEVYFRLAVKLYKAAKCSDDAPTRDHYMQWAARALGHALHLVQDMGSPQHARPESHAPWPLGHGWSFHEFWSLDTWDPSHQQTYTYPDGSGSVQVGGFESAAGADFSVVPVPPGEVLSGYGWFEDQSCWTASVGVAAAHSITAALTKNHHTVNVDGFFDRWPPQAAVLLRKSAGGTPALLALPLGNGRVVVTADLRDWTPVKRRWIGAGQAPLRLANAPQGFGLIQRIPSDLFAEPNTGPDSPTS